MKSFFGIIVIVFSISQFCFAQSYFRTGLSLIENAHEWEKYYHGNKNFSVPMASLFQGYVIGAIDAHGETITTPDSFKADQACAIVSKYLENHPERLNEPAAILVVDALKNVYK